MRNPGLLVVSFIFVAAGCAPDPVIEAASQAPQPVLMASQANQVINGGQVGDHYQTEPPFWVRPGFKVTRVATGLVNSRFITFDDKGTLYLGRPGQSDVLTLKLQNGQYTLLNTFVDKMPFVQSMQWKDGWMWVAASRSIIKARDTNGDGKADETQTILPDLVGGTGHWWRSLLVTDDTIYTSVGDPENISDQTSTDREKIFAYSIDGKSRRIFASGLRNTEKLMLRPGTTEVWGMDHGSDWFGGPLGDRQGRQPITDLNPPEEFNHYVEGGFYGHPFITGNRVPRVEFQGRPDIIDLAEKTIPPAWAFGAHWAPNGFTFYTGKQFPAEYQGDAFCAMHGSWNSKVPSGYRIERVLFDKVTGQPYGSQMIVGTMDSKGHIQARPVDVAQAPDGTLLFTDDKTQSIYRLEWVGS